MENKILIYDDNCPLCCWYSNLFVKYGFLKAEGRKAFSTIDPSLLTAFDIERGRNEIPFIDTKTRQTLYGVDALLEILGSKFPFLKKTGRIKPVYWFSKKLYKLISFNRKVIVAKKCGPGTFDCAPEMNYFYRLLFLFVFLAFNTMMLIPIHYRVLSKLPCYHLSSGELQGAHFLFASANCILSLLLKRKKSIEYLGQVNMLALTSILLLIPLLLLSLFSLPT
jgi:predicted DCC family thiol-disulfide oxidoreductase YuxK